MDKIETIRVIIEKAYKEKRPMSRTEYNAVAKCINAVHKDVNNLNMLKLILNER